MKKLSWLTITRLLACGAILGIALGNIVGIDVSSQVPNDLFTGALGATGAAIALKLVHIL